LPFIQNFIIAFVNGRDALRLLDPPHLAVVMPASCAQWTDARKYPYLWRAELLDRCRFPLVRVDPRTSPS
jgi:hypothetical protein